MVVTDDDKRGEVDAALEMWARWAHSAMSSLGWARMNIIGRIMKYGVRGAAQSAGLSSVEENKLCEFMDRSLMTLTESERRVVVRHYMRHETQKASAKAIRMGYDSFRETLKRARRKLSKLLEERKDLLASHI